MDEEFYEDEDEFEDIFPVQLTAVTVATFVDESTANVYDWVEQTWDPVTGKFKLANPARQGTYSVDGKNPAVEMNNILVPLPAYVWLKYRTTVANFPDKDKVPQQSQPMFEFNTPPPKQAFVRWLADLGGTVCDSDDFTFIYPATLMQPVKFGAEGNNFQEIIFTESQFDIPAGSNITVTPYDMTGIIPGTILYLNGSTPSELVTVKNITKTTFTADFQHTHTGTIFILGPCVYYRNLNGLFPLWDADIFICQPTIRDKSAPQTTIPDNPQYPEMMVYADGQVPTLCRGTQLTSGGVPIDPDTGACYVDEWYNVDGLVPSHQIDASYVTQPENWNQLIHIVGTITVTFAEAQAWPLTSIPAIVGINQDTVNAIEPYKTWLHNIYAPSSTYPGSIAFLPQNGDPSTIWACEFGMVFNTYGNLPLAWQLQIAALASGLTEAFVEVTSIWYHQIHTGSV